METGLRNMMKRKIRVDLARIGFFYSGDVSATRKEQILARKNAIYQYRNQLLSQQLECEITNDHFDKTAHGKPYLNTSKQLHLNHSHSQHFYALAASNYVADIGVDIEELERKVRFEALAKHAFHPEEYQIWLDLECDPNYWFRVWTTKESILKASGLGIRMSMNELNTRLHRLHHGGMCEHEKLGVFAYQNYYIQGCILSVAWRAEQSCHGFSLPEIEIIQHS